VDIQRCALGETESLADIEGTVYLLRVIVVFRQFECAAAPWIKALAVKANPPVLQIQMGDHGFWRELQYTLCDSESARFVSVVDGTQMIADRCCLVGNLPKIAGDGRGTDADAE